MMEMGGQSPNRLQFRLRGPTVRELLDEPHEPADAMIALSSGFFFIASSRHNKGSQQILQVYKIPVQTPRLNTIHPAVNNQQFKTAGYE
ncbi:MAG: hypothetical protein WCH85_08330 [Methanomicrobiales archaeon]